MTNANANDTKCPAPARKTTETVNEDSDLEVLREYLQQRADAIARYERKLSLEFYLLGRALALAAQRLKADKQYERWASANVPISATRRKQSVAFFKKVSQGDFGFDATEVLAGKRVSKALQEFGVISVPPPKPKAPPAPSPAPAPRHVHTTLELTRAPDALVTSVKPGKPTEQPFDIEMWECVGEDVHSLLSLTESGARTLLSHERKAVVKVLDGIARTVETLRQRLEKAGVPH